jgi:histone H2B
MATHGGDSPSPTLSAASPPATPDELEKDKGKQKEGDVTPTSEGEDDKDKGKAIKKSKLGLGSPSRSPASSPAATGQTVQSDNSGRTMLSEDGYGGYGVDKPGKDKDKLTFGLPHEDVKPVKSRARKAGATKARERESAPPKRSAAKTKRMLQTRKVVKAAQVKHDRSFSSYINKILKSAASDKRITAEAMMIKDSFANDLCDKIIAAATELTATAGKKQLGSRQIKTAVKLVLPPDMAKDAVALMDHSVKSYSDVTKKYKDQIGNTDKLRDEARARHGAANDAD